MSLASPLISRDVRLVRIFHTLATLVFASAVCTGMLAVRFYWAHNLRFAGLFGNLLLAWIPLGLALLIRQMPPAEGRRRLWFWTAVIAWVLFFPNAFYIVTDLIHMNKFGMDGVVRWYDMLMTACFASGGIFIGCLSLYLMHLLVRQRFGWHAGWGFAIGMLGLGAFGIYMGRVLRLNSWDVVARPSKLVKEIASVALPGHRGDALAFSLMFFFFSLAAYSFVVSMARLHEND